jgi:5-methylcytosine-specific restriction protein A
MSDPNIYRTPEWQAIRARVLREQPICAACRMAKSSRVDHVKAHKGDRTLFLDRKNLQGLCESCHNSKSASRDGGWGRKPSERPLKGVDAKGNPTDVNHPWNK